jgi:hypothetical protein
MTQQLGIGENQIAFGVPYSFSFANVAARVVIEPVRVNAGAANSWPTAASRR